MYQKINVYGKYESYTKAHSIKTRPATITSVATVRHSKCKFYEYVWNQVSIFEDQGHISYTKHFSVMQLIDWSRDGRASQHISVTWSLFDIPLTKSRFSIWCIFCIGTKTQSPPTHIYIYIVFWFVSEIIYTYASLFLFTTVRLYCISYIYIYIYNL